MSVVQAQSSRLDSIVHVLPRLANDSNKVKTYLLACRYTSGQQIDLTKHYADSAYNLAVDIHYQLGEANANIYQALYYNLNGNTPRAVELMLKALTYFEETHQLGLVATCNNNIGVIYLDQDQLDEALHYFNDAHKAWSAMQQESGMVRSLFNIAEVYKKRQQYEQAMEHYKQSLTLCKKIQDLTFCSQILSAMGSLDRKLGHYDQSRKHIEESLKYAQAAKSLRWQGISYSEWSELDLAMKEPAKALVHAKQALVLLEQFASRSDLLDTYDRLYRAYHETGDDRQAFHYQSIYLDLRDSIRNSDNLVAIEKLKTRYEMDKKESEIKLLQEQHRISSLQLYILLALATLAFLITILIYGRHRLIAKRKLELRRQQLNLYVRSLQDKSETIQAILKELEDLKNSPPVTEEDKIGKFHEMLHSNILTEKDWENFKSAFEQIYPTFFTRLRYQYPTITTAELRMCALMKLNLSIKESADMLGISPDSVKTARYRLKKKFGLDTERLEDVVSK